MVARKRIGTQTVCIKNDVKIISGAAIVGSKESEGPLGQCFDMAMPDEKWGENTYEQAESKLQREAIIKAVEKAGKTAADINYILAGDLLNQCISTHYAVRSFDAPFLGLYGACSTMSESLSIGAMLIDGGFAENTVCGTSSHFYSAERQYRLPIEYGGQRSPTAQRTVTGSGMAVLSNEGSGPFITHITTGKIIDKGIDDASNMGAAMAPAAVDTLLAHFNDTGKTPKDYDLIVTGDLGTLGMSIVKDLMSMNGMPLGDNYNDCGAIIFDCEKQQMECGGSGCGCSAVVLCGKLLNDMSLKRYSNILFIGTGSLMSPTSSLQGETIPCIAHAVSITNTKE